MKGRRTLLQEREVSGVLETLHDQYIWASKPACQFCDSNATLLFDGLPVCPDHGPALLADYLKTIWERAVGP